MRIFVRFVLTILLAGMVINLTIVLLANAQSQRQQAEQYEARSRRFKLLLAEVSGRTRRADMILEKQRLDARNNPLESTLLVRQYQATGAVQTGALPAVRFVIPGDQVEANGMLLEFDPQFSGQDGEYKLLQDTQLVFFTVFCGAGEKPAAHAPDERFTFMPRDQAPELLRERLQASFFELKLWQSLWREIPELPPGTVLPWTVNRANGHLKATWLKPDTITVQLDSHPHLYTAFVSADGKVEWKKDLPGQAGVVEALLLEGKRLDLTPDE
jgi:hypothetical protein